MIPYFDLHCDTALELYNKNLSFKENNLHISLNKSKIFYPYFQIASIWSDYRLSNDDAFYKATHVADHFKKYAHVIEDFSSAFYDSSFILGIEDARILNGSLLRLNELFSLGIRVITLNWKGENCIGGGWDTNLPLTPFGRDTVKKCCDLGVTVDLSHSSYETFFDALEIITHQGKAPIASHSNSFTVFNHNRNLKDEQFIALRDLNSVVGISLESTHLGDDSSLLDVLNHIEHYLSLNGENTIALGCDFDGVSSLPKGINNISDLQKLYSLLKKEFCEKIAEKIFFNNAYNFFIKNFWKGANYVNIHNR